MATTEQEYKEHIMELTNEHLGARAFSDIVRSVVKTPAVSCVDHNCEQVGGGAFPGSLWGIKDATIKLDYLKYLFEELSTKGVVDLTAYTHHYCGFLFAKLGLDTLASQLEYAQDTNPLITEIAIEQYGIAVTWADPRPNGTAKPWMK